MNDKISSSSFSSLPGEKVQTFSPAPRVLIVDDLPANTRLLSGILKVEGFEVVVANDGKTALGKLSETDPDVVLLDVMMPGMDGFQVCSHIRSNPETSTVPVVMVTALHETVDRVRALQAGADDFLTKPVEEVEVVARVYSLARAKRERDALETAYREIKAAESLRDSLTEMLVHDLRTPLTTMLASLDMLQTGMTGKLEPMQQEVTDMCMRGGRHLLSLVNELLDISKLESGEMQLQSESINVTTLLEEAVAHVSTQARNIKAEIQVQAAPGLPSLWADEDFIRRVLINLLGNAIKFTRRDSAVVLTAQLQHDSEGNNMLFAVEDKGEGISPEDTERIFDKFAQAQNRREGRRNSTGLGLTFCKLAVEAHGGRIWVESTLGEGSTFFFVIPIKDKS